MKLKVRIGQREFVVEVGDLQTRPIVATVDGQRFEVWPEAAAAPAPPASENSARVVRAPIPGIIVSIAVQPGQAVALGQELCVLEAMKMKNLIRARRSGRIASIYASTGQHVEHHQALMEFAD